MKEATTSKTDAVKSQKKKKLHKKLAKKDKEKQFSYKMAIPFPANPIRDHLSNPSSFITRTIPLKNKYAGKQVLGPFHKSFTSIVGPNGSGKSNVIDSMLFVFGYKASKIR